MGKWSVLDWVLLAREYFWSNRHQKHQLEYFWARHLQMSTSGPWVLLVQRPPKAAILHIPQPVRFDEYFWYSAVHVSLNTSSQEYVWIVHSREYLWSMLFVSKWVLLVYTLKTLNQMRKWAHLNQYDVHLQLTISFHGHKSVFFWATSWVFLRPKPRPVVLGR